MTEKAAKD